MLNLPDERHFINNKIIINYFNNYRIYTELKLHEGNL